VVTARVQHQVAGLFVAEERGSHELKGVPEPVTLYRIVRASGAGRRAGKRHLTPLVGREEELAMLMRRWERAPAPKRRDTGAKREQHPHHGYYNVASDNSPSRSPALSFIRFNSIRD
jgi:hypothetical protein